MSDIAANWQRVCLRVSAAARRAGRGSDEVTVVAVSKGSAVTAIQEALAAGVVHLGENRVQEAEGKITALAALGYRPTWHLIGHLQTNKVKTAVAVFDIIESVDSLRLAEAIAQRAAQPVPVLLQVNVAAEPTKSGFRLEQMTAIGAGEPLLPALERIMALANLRVAGLMTIAPQVSDPAQVRPVFRRLRELRDRLGLRELSMGMTDDFEVAVEEGATSVRIGRAIFGEQRVALTSPTTRGKAIQA